MARRKRFTSEKSANSFAKKVNGKVNDLRNVKAAKSPFTVTYEPSAKTKAHGNKFNESNDWSPEENRDFGYPNEYWE